MLSFTQSCSLHSAVRADDSARNLNSVEAMSCNPLAKGLWADRILVISLYYYQVNVTVYSRELVASRVV